jgi:hypothetical protein
LHATRWIFSEGNNPAGHCDVAWAGRLTTEASDFHFRSACGAVV